VALIFRNCGTYIYIYIYSELWRDLLFEIFPNSDLWDLDINIKWIQSTYWLNTSRRDELNHPWHLLCWTLESPHYTFLTQMPRKKTHILIHFTLQFTRISLLDFQSFSIASIFRKMYRVYWNFFFLEFFEKWLWIFRQIREMLYYNKSQNYTIYKNIDSKIGQFKLQLWWFVAFLDFLVLLRRKTTTWTTLK
jgi:hypothetical protein